MRNLLNITSDPNETIQDVRTQLLFLILIIINILGVPIVIIGFIEAFILGQYLTASSYIIFFSPVLFATIFRKKISYQLCTGSILLSLYLIGIINLIIYGFSGAATPIFLLLLVFTTVFFDIKAGFKAVLLCLLPMLIVGFLYIQNILSLDISLREISTIPVSWFTASAVLFFFGILIVLSFGIIQKKMLHSMQFSKQKADEFKRINLQLNENILIRKETETKLRNFHNKLEDLIKERTKELEEKNIELEKFNKLFIGRELRIKELKDKVRKLKENEK
ncbi:MAG: hypothetical protein KAS71_07315 [Bacteroidales bacterium]|nr:hypothetical protein [Bacteroidales bacterium]